MSRSKKDILDTESMLARLTNLLSEHRQFGGRTTQREDAESLRRISMTLHRWHELECGDSNEYGSWAIVRGKRTSERVSSETTARK